MSRIGTNINQSSDNLEAKYLPDVDEPQPDQGGEVDLLGDGQHKIYMHRGQLDIYNFGSKNTKVRAARGFGKTSLLGIDSLKCVLGLRRMIGLFLGASAKQLMCRTMPNVLKIYDMMGFQEGVFYFRGQAPAKLHWEMPLAKIRNWENCVHFQNGAVMMGISMAVKGSCNGINAAWMRGDETKYMPWSRVKEEAFPTVRGDFMPTAMRKTEKKQWGYGIDPKVNNRYCSTMFVSDAGLTQKQCEWEKEEMYETHEINNQIAEMLAELRYLEKTNPRLAVQLAQNEAFLKQLHLLRSQSESFWNFSSLENASMLGGEAWIRQMKRELPDLMFRIQILGQKKGAAKDGFYANFDIDIHGYAASDADTERLILDKHTHVLKGKALDAQKWPTPYETMSVNYDECQAAADTCALDVDVDYTSPLLIAIDANANLNCMVVGQTRMFEGRESLMILKSLFVMNERKLRSLIRDEFTGYYKPFLRRTSGRSVDVVFYYDSTIKQGASTSYAVEGSIDSRFDRVVVDELHQAGWRVLDIDTGAPIKHASKYQMINDCLAFATAPAIRINREAGRNDYLITAIENAGVDSNTFKKDKSREKLGQGKGGHEAEYEGLGGDPRTRTDITDALDALIVSVKMKGTSPRKIGGKLRGRFHNLAGIPKG